MLQDVNQHLAKAVDMLNNLGQGIRKDIETKEKEVTKIIIQELKKGSDILTDYLSQFPDN